MFPFVYPMTPLVRKHGPSGYPKYETYKEWLRDEFLFRCVYCLHREQWHDRAGTFNIDHFVPVSVNPDGKVEYDNLVYACATCNNAKRALLTIPNPATVAFGQCVRVEHDGTIESLNDAGILLVSKLRMNNPANVRHRFRWIRVINSFFQNDPELYQEFMGFPVELPDLEHTAVPGNSKPDGVKNCCFALRAKNELPAIY